MSGYRAIVAIVAGVVVFGIAGCATSPGLARRQREGAATSPQEDARGFVDVTTLDPAPAALVGDAPAVLRLNASRWVLGRTWLSIRRHQVIEVRRPERFTRHTLQPDRGETVIERGWVRVLRGGVEQPLPSGSVVEAPDRFEVALPSLAVGDLVEIVIEQRGTPSDSVGDLLAAELPTVRSAVEIVVDNKVSPELMVRLARPVLHHVRHDPWQTMSFELRDVPGYRDDAWTVKARELVPWWSYQELTGRGPLEHRLHSLEARLAELEAFTLPQAFSVDGCGDDRACRIEGVLAALLALEPVESPTWGLSIASLFATGEASAYDRTLVLWHALRRAGVDATLALSHSSFGPPPDERHLWPGDFSTLIVRVEGTPALFLDGSCHACRPGQLPERARGTRALLLARDAQGRFQPGRFVDVSGAAVPYTGQRLITTRIAADGTAFVDVTVIDAPIGTGKKVMRRVERPERELVIKEYLRDADAPPHVVATLGDNTLERDRAGLRDINRYDFTVVGSATVDADGRLHVLPWGLRNTMEPHFIDAAEKTLPYVLASTDDCEVLTAEAPAGYRFISGPAEFMVEGAGVVVRGDTVLAGDRAIVRRCSRVSGGRRHRDANPTLQRIGLALRAFTRTPLVLEPIPAATADATTTTTTTTD